VRAKRSPALWLLQGRSPHANNGTEAWNNKRKRAENPAFTGGASGSAEGVLYIILSKETGNAGLQKKLTTGWSFTSNFCGMLFDYYINNV